MKKSIRKRIEAQEFARLDEELAFFAAYTKGREKAERECSVRTCFQKDRDRIVHSESFRKLKDKTQVFIFGNFIHPRTRLTHTLEVSQIARTIARALRCNEDLVEAIALGHDLGHAPFGHLGERIINERVSYKFHHSFNSLRIVDHLEKNGKGLNLTFEVRDGILKHSKSYKGINHILSSEPPFTKEAEIVRVSDSIAYLNHDIYDSIRMGIIKIGEFPKESMKALGARHSVRVSKMVKSVIEYSMKNKIIGMDEELLSHTDNIRKFMFDNIYIKADESPGSIRAEEMLKMIWDFYQKDRKRFLKDFVIRKEYDTFEKMMADKISALTDNEVGIVFQSI